MKVFKPFAKEMFLHDPLFFESMTNLLKGGRSKLDVLSKTLNDAAKHTGLLKDHVSNELLKAVMNKEWLARSVDHRTKFLSTLRPEDKKKMFWGMILTRAVDNCLKQIFLSGEITFKGAGFAGKGFRSLGQEAIYAAGLGLKHGIKYNDKDRYLGDVAAPLIRDLGLFLVMSNDDVEVALNAQAGKSGKPCDGRDLHLGDLDRGLLTPAAPLAIATCTLLGFALSFKLKNEPRVAISLIGEGGTSLGEWHEAINFASVLNLPMIFCIENNQTALSTEASNQSRLKSFAKKAIAYGINSLSIDGNDPEAIACAFKFAADEARSGQGPVLIELTTMRMCGHAHHDDMLYLGYDPYLGFDIGPLKNSGYANKELYEQYRAKDPIKNYEKKLIDEGVITLQKAQQFKDQARIIVKNALERIKKRPWPKLFKNEQQLVFKNPWLWCQKTKQKITKLDFSSTGSTYLQAIAQGIKDSLIKHKNCLVIGEDVAPPYGNAFMMFKDLNKEFHHRFINTPISENAIVGSCVGLALSGFKPVGEIQFNDFVACAMDQVVNNAAKTYFRLQKNVPLVLRMPYGGLRRAGPYHSQDTSPWFYRTPGLKIMAPSTPVDALLMIKKAVDDEDPVLFFEHIALYRQPKIKQNLAAALNSWNLDGASLVQQGNDLTIITYGAYVHVAINAATKLSKKHNIKADVIDLRYLMPIDFDTIYTSIKKTSRALLVGEDAKTGSILESIASKIGSELFSYLDAPIMVLGSKNIPVPYAPSLEDEYLLSENNIIEDSLKLVQY